MMQAIFSLILMGGLMSFAEEKMVCKDGICIIEEHKNTPVGIQEEKKATAQESSVIEITTENFDIIVKNGKKPVVVDFYATWCQPCTYIKPIFAELAQEEKNWIFAAVDIDKSPMIMQNCGVQVIPTFVVFKNGIQWGMVKGGLSKEQLIEEFKKIMVMDSPVVRSQSDRVLELFMAINQRNLDAVKKLIAAGTDLNLTLETPQGNFSSLNIAIISGTEEVIDLLISSGAVMDKTVEESMKKHIDISANMIEILQKNFNYAKNRIIALSVPIKQVVKIHGPELGQQFKRAMVNPLELKNLIEQGADVNAIFGLGNNETTPIYLAIVLNNNAAIDMLIDAGALLSIEITNEHGCKKSVEEGIKEDIESYNQGIIKSRERLAYALSKVKLK